MSELLGADTDALDRIAESLRADARRVHDIRALAQRAVGELQAVWNGPDLIRLTRQWEQQVSPQLAGASANLETCATQLRAQSMAQKSASQADGGGAGPYSGSGLLVGGGALVGAAALPGSVGVMPTAPATAPPRNGSPTSNAAWWNSLTPAQQQQVIRDHPAWIGNRDGVPGTARDQANRALLPIYREQLLAEKARLEKQQPGNPVAAFLSNKDEALSQVNDKLKSLSAIEEVLAKQGERQLLVLDLGPERAEAAIVNGNIDTADNVSVFVPGLDTTVDGDLVGYDKQLDELNKRTELESRRAGSGDTAATVTWIGYQAPQMGAGLLNPNTSVANDNPAIAGAVKLAPFLQGIDASRESDAHLTVLAHSYGSTTAGLALQRPTGVDDVVFFGSPGIGTNHVGDLNVPAGHTYLIEAKYDVVADVGRFGGDPSFIDGIGHASARASTVVDPATGEVRQFTASEGHSEYLKNQSTSQLDMSLIAAGLPGRVVPDLGIGVGDLIGLGLPDPQGF